MELGVVEFVRGRLLRAVVVAELLEREPRAGGRGEQILLVGHVITARGATEREREREHEREPPADHGMYSTPIDGKIGSPLVWLGRV